MTSSSKPLKHPTVLSPRLNECTASLTGDYVESPSFVKITRTEGEIDFMVAPDLTDQPHMILDVAGSAVKTEAPVEIVIKKAFYCAAEIRIRDVFDLAVVIDRERERMERGNPCRKESSIAGAGLVHGE